VRARIAAAAASPGEQRARDEQHAGGSHETDRNHGEPVGFSLVGGVGPP
jgi:hypothetical protein